MMYETDKSCRVREHACSIQSGCMPDMQALHRRRVPDTRFKCRATNDDHADVLHTEDRLQQPVQAENRCQLQEQYMNPFHVQRLDEE